MRVRFKACFRILTSIVVSLCLLLTIVIANGAKPTEDPSGSGGILFDEHPDISLTKESITFRVMESNYISQARVKVEYEMKNLLNQEQSFDLLFVVPPIRYSVESQTPRVIVNGTDVTTQIYYTQPELPLNWSPKLPARLIEPISKRFYHKVLVDQNMVSSLFNTPHISAINIPIIMEAQENIKLVIEYTCEGGFNREPDYKNPIFSFLYYMTPAKFWNYEPEIQLNVELPKNQDFAFHSSIPMEETSPNSFTTQLNKLPDQEWIFSFVDKQGLIYGTNLSKTHNMITLIIAVIILTLAFLAARYYKKKYYLKWGYILSVLYIFAQVRKIVDGYIGDFFIWIAIAFVLIILIPSVYYLNSKENQGM